MSCGEEQEKNFFIVDFENDAGFLGWFGMSKELYDESEHEEVSYMIMRVIDAWLKRRSFVHNNVEMFKTLC